MMMTAVQATIASGLLFASQVGMAQQSVPCSHRIICTPPSGKLVKMVKPVFPAVAKSKGIFGTVIVEAEIDKTGTPTSVKLLDGNPVLACTVLDAVKKWRWKPYKLNGVAVEVETTISVNFEPFLNSGDKPIHPRMPCDSVGH